VRRPITLVPLLLLLLPAGCGGPAPYATTVGLLQPGSTMQVHIAAGTLNVFQPAIGDPRDRFTIAATAQGKAAPPPAPRMRPIHGGVAVDAGGPFSSLLVRVPDGVDLVVDSTQGDVHVTNITGNANITIHRGDGQIVVGGYAQATDDRGNMAITMGATHWPGTLQFSARQGDIVIWITETAAFYVHMHTDNGTLFSDFDLRGTSAGRSETIDGKVNGGGPQRVDIEDANGSIRLLRLHPEA
jgi:hypothetical protein